MWSSSPAVADVVLNIYDLTAEENTQEDNNRSSLTGFFARMLTPMGMGAYHTSLEVRGSCYTFGQGSGIAKSPCDPNNRRYVPRNAAFRESITLGSCDLSRGQINEVVTKLGKLFFTTSSYHLVHRNCNHFTETFATALILADKLADASDTTQLESYPKWVNRLAKSGASLGVASTSKKKTKESSEDTTVPSSVSVCNVLEEAKQAVGAHETVGWDITSSKNKSTSTKSQPRKKKELTAAQKAALAKLKGGRK